MGFRPDVHAGINNTFVSDSQPVPSCIDYCKKGYVTSVKNQVSVGYHSVTTLIIPHTINLVAYVKSDHCATYSWYVKRIPNFLEEVQWASPNNNNNNNNNNKTLFI